MSLINAPLADLFRSHEVDCAEDGDWIKFPHFPKLLTQAEIVGERQPPAGSSVQLDVRLQFSPRRTIVESFAGLGGSRAEAVADAFHNFTGTTFHVLLSAFFRPGAGGAVGEEWQIGGVPCRVTLGDVGARGQPAMAGEESFRWHERFVALLQQSRLDPGRHWVRLFYGQMDRQPMACEVLLDNFPWTDLQDAMAGYPWLPADDFYSVRLFLIIDVPGSKETTPESAVAQLAEIVSSRQEFTEDEIYAALAAAGIPDPLADRAYKFTQTAWGRVFLAGMGIQFSPDYLCFNAAGEVVESGRLAEERCFAAATRLAGPHAGPGLARLGLMSADAQGVNKALHAGSKPENLRMGPAGIFLEPPTQAGLDNARRMIAQHLKSKQSQPPAESGERETSQLPWWKFW